MTRRQCISISIVALGWLAAMTPMAAAQGFAQDKKAGARVAATVNGAEISVAAVENLLRRERAPVHPLTAAQKRELRKMALNMLIDDILLRDFLAKNAPPVQASQVAREVNRFKSMLAKSKNKITFAQFLQKSKQTENQIREDILMRLRWKAYLSQRLPDRLLQPYYQTNKDYFDNVVVRASHILLKTPKKTTKTQEQAIHKRLLQIRQDIVSGKIGFAAAAKAYSHCPSKKKGGDVGRFPYKFAVAQPFAKAAFSMKAGQISAPIRTNFGFHLIKVTKRDKGTPTTFAQVKEQVRAVYAREVRLYQSIIAEQRKKARIQVLWK